MSKDITISYCITVCDELEEITKLTNFLYPQIREDDELVIQYDANSVTQEVMEFIKILSQLHKNVKITGYPLNNDFGKFKSNLREYSSGDYIFNIDADEIPNLFLLENIHTIIKTNLDVDLIWVPRINTIQGDSKLNIVEYIKSQNWTINDKGWINWPHDYQGRIYKNSNQIYWIGKVHEKLTGYKAFSKLPALEEYSIYHPKTLDRQKRQNQFYEKL